MWETRFHNHTVPMRYGLNSWILFRWASASKLKSCPMTVSLLNSNIQCRYTYKVSTSPTCCRDLYLVSYTWSIHWSIDGMRVSKKKILVVNNSSPNSSFWLRTHKCHLSSWCIVWRWGQRGSYCFRTRASLGASPCFLCWSAADNAHACCRLGSDLWRSVQS
jgi:hypothetical protein